MAEEVKVELKDEVPPVSDTVEETVKEPKKVTCIQISEGKFICPFADECPDVKRGDECRHTKIHPHEGDCDIECDGAVDTVES